MVNIMGSSGLSSTYLARFLNKNISDVIFDTIKSVFVVFVARLPYNIKSPVMDTKIRV